MVAYARALPGTPVRYVGLPRTPGMTFKRCVYDGTWTFGTAVTNDFWRYVEAPINKLPDIAEYATIFDEYRINAVKYTFRPRFDSNENGATNPPQSYAHVILDPNSTITPTGVFTQNNLNAFLQNGNVKTYSCNRPFSVYYRPRYYAEVSATTVGLHSTRTGFLRIGDNTIMHRGFHMFLQPNQMSSANVNLVLDIHITYYVTMRGAR